MVSIIIPVYNIEKYIGCCIESVLVQTYKDIQVILVDDGSQDRSGQICDEYLIKDPRVEVVHKVNGGVSSARNEGIRKAKGEYVCFIDGDDEIDREMIEILVKSFETHDIDMSICSYTTWTTKRRIKKVVEAVEINELDRSFDKMLFLYENYLLNPIWNKMFKKKLIVEFFDENISVGEDLAFVLAYLKNVKAIRLLKECLYMYRVRDDSATTTFQPNRINTIIDLNEMVGAFFQQYSQDELKEKVYFINLGKIDAAFQSLICDFVNKKCILAKMKTWCGQIKLRQYLACYNTNKKKPYKWMIDEEYNKLYKYYKKRLIITGIKKGMLILTR